MPWRGFWRRGDATPTQQKNQARSMSNGGSEHTAGLIYLGKTDSKRPAPAVSSVSCEFLVLLEDYVVHAAAFCNAGVLDDRCFYAVLCDELLERVLHDLIALDSLAIISCDGVSAVDDVDLSLEIHPK